MMSEQVPVLLYTTDIGRAGHGLHNVPCVTAYTLVRSFFKPRDGEPYLHTR
jgi:hypothetical protein